jgi:ribonucleoside-diphosphate reductase alpha chain
MNVLVRRRNGDITEFHANKIETALMNAFIGTDPDLKNSQSVHSRVDGVLSKATAILQEASLLDSLMDVEFIQDCVERALMASDEHAVLRAYILYRESHKKNRQEETVTDTDKWTVQVKHGSRTKSLNVAKIKKVITESCAGLTADSELVFNNFKNSVYNGITNSEVFSALVLAVRPLIETHPDYAYVAARLHFYHLRKEVIGRSVTASEMQTVYPIHFKNMIAVGIKNKRIAPEMANFDLDRLGAALCGERDNLFMYQGAQILTDRYFLHVDDRHIELPQTFFMRVAMGLALLEDDKEARAIEFYNVLSQFDLVTSTPTLFNSGTLRPQLSSCFLSTVGDNLNDIYEAIKENALLSKYSGGLGNDWTPVRGLGSEIKGTNGKSQGIIPFLKVVNDTAVAVNQCFAPDTLVYTQDGIKEISAINKGDCVLGRNGVYREVQETMTYPQKDPMLEIKVKHGIHPEKLTDAHPLFALQGVPLGESMRRTLKKIDDGKLVPMWVESGSLKVGDYLAQVIPSEVVQVHGFTDDDAYLYGLMLGDGHIAVRNCINREYGITLNATSKEKCVDFVKKYLDSKEIHYWENTIHESAKTVRWSYGRENVRNVVNGQFESGEDTPCLPFTYADLYNENSEKRIASRFLHLPEQQTLNILKGLLETDGHISRGKEIMFSSSSLELIENVRYLLLRLGVACSGRIRNRTGESHTLTRKDGSCSTISGGVSYELRIPADTRIANLLGCAAVTKQYALRMGKWLFSRITEILPIQHVPFVCDLKVDGDESYMTSSFLAHNGGKRKGAVCVYLETWHIDMEEFLELRKNTGDDRRRTHDMNTANWIPDLFMERVEARGDWTLFSPDEVPDLHDLFGLEFKKRYEHYEKMAAKGLIKVHKTVSALEMWRKMLTMLLETGHPWITFKDTCNVRSPQQHVGVVHSSNLCVAPETVVLTDKGHIPILELQDKEVKVWNGMMFSDTIVRKTGENQKLITVSLSNGAKLACTPYHIFHIKNDYAKKSVEVRAGDLKTGDKLIKAEYPIINNHEWADFPSAYTHGFFCGDGTYGKPDYKKPMVSLYGEKKELLPFLNVRTGSNKETANGVLHYTLHQTLEQKFTVPTSHSLKSRVEWFAGLCDADGSITKNGKAYGIQIGSIHADFLENVRLMLQTIGVYSTVALMSENRRNLLPDGKGGNKVYECQDLYRLLIAHDGLIMLNRLGFNPHRLIMPTTTTQRRAEHFVTVVSIADTGRVADTYCFSEPIRHMGVFNGVLTGQCTEITLNSTSDTETAVCNLASINLAQHMKPRTAGQLVNMDMFDTEKMERTIKTGMRMLDNVVDLNYYAIEKARNSNTQHHPVGLGVMGFVDAMGMHRISYNSMDAVEFADISQEIISYYAISASSDLARERGSYSSFDGSLWSKGILPIDSLEMMEAIRHIDVDRKRTMDWDSLRNKVMGGMRNSNCLAIAPTATIANIIGVSQGIEPIYQNLYVKSNLSGEFTVLNPSMVKDMMELGIWDAAMIMDLKFYDGSLSKIDRVPQELKELYVTAFEMDPMYLIECASRRQKWIDQSQSVNVYFNNPKGKLLDMVYTQAWKKGLKTTYYLRSLSATSAEKSTGKAGALNAVKTTTSPEPKSCLLDDPTCEACQ